MTAGLHYDGSRAAHIGWRPTAYGYHSDDGSKWRHDKLAAPRSNGTMIQGERFGEPFGSGARLDVIGCGLDHARRSVFFTKNGVLQGTAFEDVDTAGLLPTVSLHEKGDRCSFNFGTYGADDGPAVPFLFDLPSYAASEARHAGVVGGGEIPVPEEAGWESG